MSCFGRDQYTTKTMTRKQSIKKHTELQTITLDNIYKLMLNFGKLYDIISDEEKKSLITYLIKEIQIYPNGESDMPLKSIEFNFPIYRDGQEVRRLLWEKGNTVETVVLLGRKMVNDKSIEYMHVDYEPEDDEYLKGIKGSATYAEIKKWIKEQYNVSVSSLYIAQVKDKLGFEKRDNYNKGAEGHKVPNCPAEKRELIMKAFKHFKMI